MARIAESAEEKFPHKKYLQMVPNHGTAEAVSYAASILAKNLRASAIVATTRSGSTAAHIKIPTRWWSRPPWPPWKRAMSARVNGW